MTSAFLPHIGRQSILYNEFFWLLYPKVLFLPALFLCPSHLLLSFHPTSSSLSHSSPFNKTITRKLHGRHKFLTIYFYSPLSSVLGEVNVIPKVGSSSSVVPSLTPLPRDQIVNDLSSPVFSREAINYRKGVN